MTDAELFKRWKSLVGDDSPSRWDRDSLAGFFQCFRPEGAGIEQIFAGLGKADELVSRLRGVYRATAPGRSEGAAYFVVDVPPALGKRRALDLGRQHLDALERIGHAASDTELEGYAAAARVEILECEAPERSRNPADGPEAEIIVYETCCDWHSGLVANGHQAELLEEAYYYIACDYYLAWYLLWPIYRDSTTVQEPFSAYFELWRHGISVRFGDDRVMRLYVPNPGD